VISNCTLHFWSKHFAKNQKCSANQLSFTEKMSFCMRGVTDLLMQIFTKTMPVLQ
jgi:hypothetical protein